MMIGHCVWVCQGRTPLPSPPLPSPPLQILLLLEKMDLLKYRDVFEREMISGDVLMELGDEELKSELGIDSKIHRYSYSDNQVQHLC